MKVNELISKGLDSTVTIRDMIALMGGHVMHYPVIGDCVTLNGLRHCERDIRDNDNITISYEWAGEGVDNQTLCRIYIGHKHSGPMLSLSSSGGTYPLDTSDSRGPVILPWVWHNLYSNGNFGNNVACGGTWSSASNREYLTATDALNDRDYKIGNITSSKSYTESKKLIAEVQAFVNQWDKQPPRRDSKGRYIK